MAAVEIYAREPVDWHDQRPTVFLAGPTPRAPHVPSWRPAAVAALQRAGYRGIVLNPESRPDTSRWCAPLDETLKDDQFAWEWDGLDRVDVIAMWVARRIADMPAFTTNAEWGLYVRSGRLVCGAPSDAPKNGYLRRGCNALHVPWFDDLDDWAAHVTERANRRRNPLRDTDPHIAA